EPGKTDADKIQGVWVPVSVEKDGQKAPEEQFEGIKLKFAFDGKGAVLKGGQEMEVQYKLDPAKKPGEIDITVKEGGGEKVYKGIYKLDDKNLTICFVDEPEERPTDFTTQMGSTRQLVVLKRE